MPRFILRVIALACVSLALLQRDMRFRALLLFCLFAGCLFAQTPAPTAPATSHQVRSLPSGPAYSLPAEKLKRAEALNREGDWLWAIGTVWGLVSLLLFLRLHWAAGLHRVSAGIARSEERRVGKEC